MPESDSGGELPKVPYFDLCKVQNMLVEYNLMVFTAPLHQQTIKVVPFRHVMCLN